MSLIRQDVYAVIDGERNYQDSRWGASTIHTVAEYILYMEHHLTEARRLITTQGDPKASRDALDVLRKVIALGVVCMEQNGAVERVFNIDSSSSNL